MFLAGSAVVAIVAAALLFTFVMVRRVEAAHPPRGEFASLAGGRMHFTQILPPGEPRGVALLVHGASGNESDLALPLGQRLASRGFRVLAVDRPGHGWSDRLGAETPALQAARIIDLLDSIGVREVIVVGHSLGGVTAASLVLSFPERIRGLVLVAPVTHPWPGGVALYYNVASAPVVGPLFCALFAMPLGLLTMEGALKSVFAPGSPPPDYARRTGLARVLRPKNFAANARDVAGTFAFVTPQAARMKEIAAPTAIVTGDRDSIVFAHIHSLGSARDIAGATLTFLPGVGHSPHWADPDAVVAAIESVAERAGAEAGHP